MKKLIISAIILFLLSPYAFSSGIKIGYISPMTGPYSIFGQMLLNGMSIALGQNANINMVNSNDIQDAFYSLQNKGIKVIVGPFFKSATIAIANDVCSYNIVDVLPFYSPNNTCNNVITYRFDPYQATSQLAKLIYKRGFDNVVLLYSLDPVGMKEKDILLNKLASYGIQPIRVSGFLPDLATYYSYFKEIFGIQWINGGDKILPLSTPVVSYRLKANTVVILSDQTDFIKFANLIGFYNIDIKHILGVGISLNNNLISLNYWALKKIIAITPYNPTLRTSKNEYFIKQYINAYDTIPNEFAALGFDIGMLLNDVDSKNMKNSLLSIKDYPGLIGTLLFFNNTGKGIFRYNIIDNKSIKEFINLVSKNN